MTSQTATPGENETHACPSCDESGSQFHKRHRMSKVRKAPGKKWYCETCETGFDEPAIRELKAVSKIRADSVAAKLEAASPDAVSADHDRGDSS